MAALPRYPWKRHSRQNSFLSKGVNCDHNPHRILQIMRIYLVSLVLDVKNACWYFWDNPTHKYPFGEELDTPSIAEKRSSYTFRLRRGKGKSLTSVQEEKPNLLLEN
ncbi:hypothetical protein NPIL_345121 [Nephila pilipes]|uniref:Uncharacterized protein n=1 Tax=Nephila pilipes TaxID=299642 RepID=A0A8X6TG58_NEPPI|nr:hypothetical protein NPIL_345121 [Nephila pilipes]